MLVNGMDDHVNPFMDPATLQSLYGYRCHFAPGTERYRPSMNGCGGLRAAQQTPRPAKELASYSDLSIYRLRLTDDDCENNSVAAQSMGILGHDAPLMYFTRYGHRQ